ncbi:hypothetical protein KDH_27960 [Dictyobacter sp. S3.2.2.5]|uniref:Uncharacterized protein n=1 Tax=Dictyobacter halimunensis TaxID=3026934 RepID=A0ABQ6FSE7_9CHLR|nr:hypothetical protein KDH_27960 [Dictyobacter sp. S3.2.2.5]
MIDARQEATQRGPMGKVSAPKQGHEGWSKWNQTMKEVGQCPFPTNGISEQECKKINRFIAAETSAHETDLMRESFQKPFCGEMLGEDNHFSKPRRNRGTIRWRGLNLDVRVRYHT